MKMNKKGFTLIELLAVIVVLAIIALIATPIVMNTIKKAQEGADARSVEAYGKELESAYYQYLIDNPTADATTTDDIKTNLVTTGDVHDSLEKYVKLSGNGASVKCTGSIKTVNNVDVVSLTGCTVGSRTQTYKFDSASGAEKE